MNLRMTVDLSRIKQNVSAVRRECGTSVTVMVKADAYGHGMTRVARALRGYADTFGVATTEEGVKLRRDGITEDILVALCDGAELERAAEFGLTVGVADFGTLNVLRDIAASGCKIPRFHIKTDTGMHRLGFLPSEVGTVCGLLDEAGLSPQGFYSHLRSCNDAQINTFAFLREKLKARYPGAVFHLASSSALDREDALFDAVRIGHAAYEGAMRVESTVVAAKQLNRAEGLGYGDFRTTSACNVAWVFGGYFDGICRENASSVLIRGRLCPPVGSVCMDMFAVDTGDFVADKGENVVLLGDSLTAERVAEQRKTCDYAVMTAWRGRTERIYTDDETRGEEDCGDACREDERR